MTRREMFNSCLSGCLSGSLILAGGLLSAQQPRQEAGRATVNPRRSSAPPAQPGAQQQNGPAPRVERPSPDNMEAPLPKELEDLLVQWEEKSAKIDRLQGDFIRYVYDTVYLAETRAVGRFCYEKPDKGRMDFAPTELPNPPRIAPDKRPYTLQTDKHERWICTGQQIFIINDDQKMYDLINIPPQQQGRNIINGPLPFLFGMKAEQAKARYYLTIGKQHCPDGVTINDEGKRVRVQPQLHIIAVPKLTVDRAEWSRAEVLLTPEFLPRAIRLINTNQTRETAYIFFPDSKMTVNQRTWFPNNPFNDKPAPNYVKGTETRATDEESSASSDRVLPTNGQKLKLDRQH